SDESLTSKSVELHDKVIGHYLNIKHYQ
ncbi:IS1 family transposase, partial [Escherichia coli]